jgi:hypothetical protein
MATKLPATQIHSKVGAGAFGGACAVVFIWGLSLMGVEPPTEVAIAIGTIFMGSFGYLARS